MTARTAQLPASPATPHQRLYVRTLMQRLELDVSYITLMHRRFFEAAGVPVPEQGSRVDAALCALSKMQAVALISALLKEVSDEP